MSKRSAGTRTSARGRLVCGLIPLQGHTAASCDTRLLAPTPHGMGVARRAVAKTPSGLQPVCATRDGRWTGSGRAPHGSIAPVHFADRGRRARRVTTAPPCLDHAQPLHSANCARNTTRPGRQGGCRRAGQLRDTISPRAHPAHPARATAALLQRVAAASHIAPLVWHKHEATRTL